MTSNAVSSVAAALLLAACGAVHAQAPMRPARGVEEPRAVAPRGALTEEERTTIGIFEGASDSVVYITTVQHVRDIWTRNVMRVPQGTGSGFVWDGDGHIVTNYHVVQGAQEALIRLSDQRSYPATVVGFSAEHDLAVLRIEVPSAAPPPLAIGSSADLRVGQNVYAIGNPFGLDHTLTTGVVSALNRSIEDERGRTIENVIQTDAAINPGNSGGPLIDSAGRLIGVNTMIVSPSGAYAGIGFAVPVDTVNRVVPRLIAYGRYVRPKLGITANDEWSRRLLDDRERSGVVVLDVQPGSPADRAGLRAAQMTGAGRVVLGDVIVAFDGEEIEDFGDLVNRLDRHVFGDKVKLTVQRDRERRDVTVTLNDPESRGVL